MGVGEQQRVVQAGVGDLVAAGVRDAGDEAVFAEAAQVVSHFPGGDVLGIGAEEGRATRVRSSRLVKPRGSSRWMSRACSSAWTRGSPNRSPGMRVPLGHDDGRGQVGERVRAADRVRGDGLDAEQAPVGGEADLPQCGQVGQPFGQPEVLGVVNGGFRPDRLAQLQVLLDFRVLVVDVQGRGDSVGDDPGAELPLVRRWPLVTRRRPKTRLIWSGLPMSSFSIRGLCLAQQLANFRPQPLLRLVHPSITHGFVLARVGLELTPIHGHVPQLHRSRLQRQS